jgi:hypothetical protein
MRGLLVRGLGARRHGRRVARPGTGGAVTQREDVVVARGLQGRAHDEPVELVGLEPGQPGEKIRRLDARRPDHELGRDHDAAGEPHAVCQHLGHARAHMQVDAETLEQPDRRLRQPLGQRRENARRRLDQVDADVLVRVDAVEAEGDELPRRLVQLGGQLRARGAGADDGHMQLLWSQRLCLRVGPDAGIDEAPMEASRVLGRVQRQGMLPDAGRAEVVGHAADRNHQRVVGDLLAGRDLAALVVDERRHVHNAAGAIEARHAAGAIGEAVPVGLRQVVDGVHALVHAAGGDLVQQRLPQVRALAVDQRDRRLAAPSEPAAEPRDELQATGTAPHDHDRMWPRGHRQALLPRARAPAPVPAMRPNTAPLVSPVPPG